MCTPLRAAGCALNLATGAWVFSLNTPQKPSNDAPAEERRESPGAAARALVLVLVGVGCLGGVWPTARRFWRAPHAKRSIGRAAWCELWRGAVFWAPTRPWRSSSSH